MTSAPASPGPARSPRQIEILQLPPAALHALAAGDLPSAVRASGLPLTHFFVDASDSGVWRRRSRQIVEDPSCEPWITGVIWDAELRIPVGRAGYHGPPDAAGMVEIGYSVDMTHRRQGYARAALEALLDRAAREPDVVTVRATIRPDNSPSSSLVLQYGFVEVGEQWDDEDGLETIYEVAAGRFARDRISRSTSGS